MHAQCTLKHTHSASPCLLLSFIFKNLWLSVLWRVFAASGSRGVPTLVIRKVFQWAGTPAKPVEPLQAGDMGRWQAMGDILHAHSTVVLPAKWPALRLEVWVLFISTFVPKVKSKSLSQSLCWGRWVGILSTNEKEVPPTFHCPTSNCSFSELFEQHIIRAPLLMCPFNVYFGSKC